GEWDTVFPGVMAASNGKVARMHWPTYPLTKASYSAYKVGQYTGIAGSEIERVGNLHFCGEHTSLDAQGYMEGGALTGAMAAQEVAMDRGLAAAMVQVESGPGARIMERAAVARQYGRWTRTLRKLPRKRAA